MFMNRSRGQTRSVKLALAPTNTETLKGLGTWLEEAGADVSGDEDPSCGEDLALGNNSKKNSSEPSSLESCAPASEGPMELFLRKCGEETTLSLSQGDLVILGPANDPLRCRALPGERELRAFRMPSAGRLRLMPGVWFHQKGMRLSSEELAEFEQRSYADIFQMTFEIDESLPWVEPPKPVW